LNLIDENAWCFQWQAMKYKFTVSYLKEVCAVHLGVTVRANQQQVFDGGVGDEGLDEVQCRRIGPLHVV
jgi:hypothetical protein